MSLIAARPSLTGIHILLTYQCTFECDHCFVWGSPWQSGTLTFSQINQILEQAQRANTVKEIYFEGGEPFLYYPTLLKAVERAHQMGFEVGLVSNAYWALTPEEAEDWLRPFAGLLADLSVSSDLFHYKEAFSIQAHNASAAAEALGIPVGVIQIAQPEDSLACETHGVIPASPAGEGSAVMFRGRAAQKLAPKAPKSTWSGFRECPHENLDSPGRIHLDPYGNLHICQGILIGNLFEQPLQEIWSRFDPQRHPIIGPLLDGGPALLTEKFAVPHMEDYADACHLCYSAREFLRERFPDVLGPDAMYGVM